MNKLLPKYSLLVIALVIIAIPFYMDLAILDKPFLFKGSPDF